MNFGPVSELATIDDEIRRIDEQIARLQAERNDLTDRYWHVRLSTEEAE